ncbi:MAG: hypothetical protein HQL22_05190 [Candidatus Omnitrophica bacterium]|nr:hypothetical protein [Candidatus Omnitrophota bacterium]
MAFFLTLFFCLPVLAVASGDGGRESIINNALANAEAPSEALASGQPMDSNERDLFKESENDFFAKEKRFFASSDPHPFPENSVKEDNDVFMQPVVPQKTTHDRQHRAELAFQMASYLYKTADNWPDYYSEKYSESNKVKKTGGLYGFYGAYTWNTFEPLRSWSDIWKKTPYPNFVRVEAEGSIGQVDYSSYVTGKKQGFDARELDARFLFGYDYVLNDSTLLTPYIGFGYRMFSDNAGGWVDYFVNDYAQYTTKTSIYYVPVGVESLTKLNEKWDLGLKLEGDLVVAGSVDYALNEIPGTFTQYHDANTNAPLNLVPRKASSRLKGGFGFRTSMKIIRKYDHFNIFTEPYLKLWYLRKTEPEQAHSFDLTSGGDYVSVNADKSAYKPLWDPQSVTAIAGLRMGVQF